MKKHAHSFFLIVILSLLVSPFVFAQTDSTDTELKTATELGTSTVDGSDLIKINNLSYNSSVNESDIDVIVDPEFPAAFQNVSIRLDSNSIDLNRYPIQWFVNDIPKVVGIGKRDYNITSGGYGSNIQILVVITTGGTSIRKTINIAPRDVTVLWEAIDSYTPPFYRGKKLAPQESLIKVSAIPNFQNNNSLQLGNAVFLWSRNGNKILNVGGYNKDSIVIEHNKLRTSEVIEATVSTVSGGASAKKSATINIAEPEVHWYVRDEFNYRRLRSIDEGLRVASGDINLVAEPYYFSINKGIQDLDFTWKVNNESIYLDPTAPRHELTVHNPGKDGQVIFDTSIETAKTFLQSATSSVILYFQGLKK